MIIVLGAFDGYHKGHQRLFRAAEAMAGKDRSGWAVVSFTPHPRMVLMQEKISLLFSSEEKRVLEALLEIPTVFSLPFTSRLSSMEPEEFFSHINEELPISGIVVGYDFRFGQGRRGNTDSLQKLCRERKINLEVISPFQIDDMIVSSTNIRDLVERGKTGKAEELLGYPFLMQGSVTEGKSRGRSMGFPTANITVPESKIVPLPGVYAGAVFTGKEWLPSAISIGRNPTFGDLDDNRIEVHLIGYSGNLYGETLNVLFFEKTRPMYKFPDIERLTSQIKMDIGQAREIFGKKSRSLDLFKRPSVLKSMTSRDMISPVQQVGL